MKNLLFLLIVFTTYSRDLYTQDLIENIFSSPPEQIVTLTNSEDYLIGDIIHPLSGQPCLRRTDLIAKGAQNIDLKRVFIPQYTPLNERNGSIHPSENSYAGWVTFPHAHLNIFIKNKSKKNREITVSVADLNGIVLSYSVDKGKTTLKTDPCGICNGIDDNPSGRYDPRNTSIVFDKSTVILKAPDGTQRYYHTSSQYDLTCDKTAYTCLYCLLLNEILPNGKILRYHYNKERQVTKVESLDPQKRYIYATLETTASIFTNHAICKTHTGSQVNYTHKTSSYFKEKQKGADLLYPLQLTEINSPFFREEKIAYCRTRESDSWLSGFDGQHPIFICNYATARPKERLQVSQLSFPNGSEGFSPVYNMRYTRTIPGKLGGSTTVSHSDGVKTVYQFNPQMLPQSVQFFDEKGVLVKAKNFEWTHNQWLESICITDGQKRLLSEKRFTYDLFGNPITETLTGDLLGNGFKTTQTTSRLFSQDGFNLLLQENFENGKIVCYRYLPQTNLLISQLTKTKEGCCQLREFREYDDCYNLTRIIEDNGSGDQKDDLSEVSQRKITSYILRTNSPFLHMPEWVEVKYLDNGTEKLLTRTHLNYDQHGNVSEENVYDANNQFAYTIYKSFNENGSLNSETNAIGQKATYAYDVYGNEISSVNFSQTLQKFTNYDRKGHPSSIKEVGFNNSIRDYLYSYDNKGRLTQKTDFYKNTTNYSYDFVNNEPIKIESAPLFTSQGEILPVVKMASYDALGRKITSTDANGNVTTFFYNMYGKPIKIVYPDQTQENFKYTLTGLLECHKKCNGLTIDYHYDILGNITCKCFSENGKSIGEEKFEYQGTSLIRYQDKEKYLTQYSYDGAGRKIREERCGCITTYNYDALGYLSTICEENGNNSLYIHYKRDLLGQILEEKKTDSNGTLLNLMVYTYDGNGNIASIERQINDKNALEVFTYDSFNREISRQDALGNLTVTKYDENSLNSFGQQVLKKIVTDPKQISKIITHDFYGRIAKKEILNPANQVIASEEQSYDACGNLLEHKDHVYHGINFLTTKTTKYEYDPCHRLKCLIRGFATAHERTTKYTYELGRLATKTMPDGVTLSYTHDTSDKVKSITSSDGTLHHSFTYNLLGQLLSATDELKKESIERILDPHGNVLLEMFPNDLSIQKTYDNLQRPLSVTFPDKSGVLYTYTPLTISNVTRTNPLGIPLYTHYYTNYDLSGYLTKESLIANLGEVEHTTDLNERSSGVSSQYFSQKCSFDNVGNLTDQIMDNMVDEFIYDDLSQLIKEPDHFYTYDSTFNRLQIDNEICQSNILDEQITSGLLTCNYDLRGNLINKSSGDEIQNLKFDPLNRLIEITKGMQKICFDYDPLGRRIAKTKYLISNSDWQESEKDYIIYDGNNDIGTISSTGEIKDLRILGLTAHPESPRTVAIEINNKPYAPLLDCQGNIRRLVDINERSITARYEFNAFGNHKFVKNTQLLSPWLFASKRFDGDIDLIDFGKRYYDPQLARWLSTDPAGFINAQNLYQYNFNNPCRYTDPDGQFIILALPLVTGAFGLGTFTIGLPTVGTIAGALTGTVLGIASYHIYQVANSSHHPAVFNENTSSGDAKDKKKKSYRTEPIDLEEQLTLEEAKGAKGNKVKLEIQDPKYPEKDWEKRSHSHDHSNGSKTEVHYWENLKAKTRHEFKIKDDTNNKSRINY